MSTASYESSASEAMVGSSPLDARPQTTEHRRSAFVSRPIVADRLRRLWPLSVVGLMVLLVSGPLLTVLNRWNRASMLRSAMEDLNIGFLGYQIAAPMLLAVLVFRYLDSMGKTAAVHALPIARGTLFRSNVAAAAILTFTPHLLLAFSLLPFVRAGFSGFLNTDSIATYLSRTEGSGNNQRTLLPDMGDLLRWLIVTGIVMLVVFAASVLASVVTGNTGIAFVVSVLLNVMALAAYAITRTILGLFLYGFPQPAANMLDWLHPLGYIAYSGTHVVSFAPLVFTIVALAVLVVANLLYRAFRSERAGDAIAFRGVEFSTTVLVTFIGMCLTGLLLYATLGTNGSLGGRRFFYLGAASGLVLIFPVITMLLKKTTRIFNRGTLRRFGVVALLSALFLAMTTVDVSGYEHRVPSQASVSSASITMSGAPMLPYVWTYGRTVTVTDPESIDALRAFHSDIVAKRPSASNMDTSSNWSGSISLHYALRRNGPLSSMSREYAIDEDFAANSSGLSDLLNSPGYRKAFSIGSMLDYDQLASFTPETVQGNSYEQQPQAGEQPRLSADDAATLARLLDEDYQSMPKASYRDLTIDWSDTGHNGNRHLLIGLRFSLRKNDNPRSPSSWPESDSFFYGITDQYTRSIAWLKSKGYYDQLVQAMGTFKQYEQAQGQ